MSARNKARGRTRLTLTLALAIAAAWHPGESLFAANPQTPPVRGGTLLAAVQTQCVTCHESDMIRQQRLRRAGWERELDKMIRWGAVVTTAERGGVLDYLAANFGPHLSPSPVTQAGTRGAEVLRMKCLVCHQSDLVEQQRLGRAGWVREIDKMTRWGAALTAPEKDLLLDYLADQFPPP